MKTDRPIKLLSAATRQSRYRACSFQTIYWSKICVSSAQNT